MYGILVIKHSYSDLTFYLLVPSAGHVTYKLMSKKIHSIHHISSTLALSHTIWIERDKIWQNRLANFVHSG